MSTNKENKKILTRFFNSFSSFKKILTKRKNQNSSKENIFDSKEYLNDSDNNDDLSIGYNIDDSENSYLENNKESQSCSAEYLKISENGSVRNITLDSFKREDKLPNKEELLNKLHNMFYEESNDLEMEYLEISNGRKIEKINN